MAKDTFSYSDKEENSEQYLITYKNKEYDLYEILRASDYSHIKAAWALDYITNMGKERASKIIRSVPFPASIANDNLRMAEIADREAAKKKNAKLLNYGGMILLAAILGYLIDNASVGNISIPLLYKPIASIFPNSHFMDFYLHVSMIAFCIMAIGTVFGCLLIKNIKNVRSYRQYKKIFILESVSAFMFGFILLGCVLAVYTFGSEIQKDFAHINANTYSTMSVSADDIYVKTTEKGTVSRSDLLIENGESGELSLNAYRYKELIEYIESNKIQSITIYYLPNTRIAFGFEK